jgi:hypothetical protein
MFDALVGEQEIWWVSVEGEREPPVLAPDRPGQVTYGSPFLWRPNDVIDLSIGPLGEGCQVHLRHASDEPFVPLEAAAIRHRWGEHIDRDLRDRFDYFGRAGEYQVSLYRGDVDDWTILDRVLGQSWRVVERLPVQVRRSGPAGRWHVDRVDELLPGDVIWAVQMGRHRTSVGCLPEAPPELEGRITTQAERTSPGYRGAEVFVPLPEFGRRLQPN